MAALNADAGAGTWAANPSSSELPAASEQDVITNAIIYKPAAVERVGEARALGDQSAGGQAFGNARENFLRGYGNATTTVDQFLASVDADGEGHWLALWYMVRTV